MPQPSTGERIIGFFLALGERFVEEFQELLRKVAPGLVGSVSEEDLARVRASNANRWGRWEDDPGVITSLLQNIREKTQEETLQSQLELILLEAAKAFAVLQFGMAPAGIEAGYRAERLLQTARFDPATAAEMLHRGIIGVDDYYGSLSDLGWDEGKQADWREFIRTRLGMADYIAWSYRAPGNPPEARRELEKLGMTNADIDKLLTLGQLIPGPGDLVRFALREAWRDDVAAKWGYDEDFVAEFAEWMTKQGYSADWAKRFWRSHWIVPSVSLGYEMFHRGIINRSELEDLLKISDYPSGWRDKMVAVAYRPITRVDIRRIYRDLPPGSVNVYKRHLILGYEPEDAALMTDWVHKEYVADVTEPLKSDILGAYGDDLIDRTTAYNMLITIGTDTWAANVALDRKDIAKAKKLQSERIRQVKTLFVNGDYTRTDVHAALGAMNLPSIRIDRLLEEWDITRGAKVARPSVAKLEGYFFRDVIDRATFIEHLGRHKYADPYLSWAVADVETRKMEALLKEEERAAKEAERIAALEIKTAYQEAKAVINYQIAELRVHLLEIRLFVERLIVGPERKEIMDIIKAAEVEVARIVAEIAGKRTDLTTQKIVLRTLAVPPDMEALYDIIDDAQIAISTEQSAIAELRGIITEAKGQIRRALPGAEVEDQRLIIDTILIDIAKESEDIANLKLVIAARKSELAEVWTSEDIAALEEEMRVIKLTIATLEAERARLLI